MNYQSQVYPIQPVQVFVPKPPKKRATWTSAALVILILCVLAGIAALAFKFTKPGSFSYPNNNNSGGSGSGGATYGHCVISCTDCANNTNLPPGTPLPLPNLDQNDSWPWCITTRIDQNSALSIVPLNTTSPDQNITTTTTNNNTDTNTVLRVQYSPFLWSTPSGAEFKGNPWQALPSDSAVLRYSVFFPFEFDFVKGGKLPGVCIGNSSSACATGSRWQWSAGSVRVMWRQEGAGIGYVYIPLQASGGDGTYTSTVEAQGSQYQRVMESSGGTGDGLFCRADGGLQFMKGEWNNVTLVVSMNDIGVKNGVISLTVNGVTRTVGDVVFRTEPVVQIVSVVFATFFGGNDMSWALQQPTYSLFRDFRFAANVNSSSLTSSVAPSSVSS